MSNSLRFLLLLFITISSPIRAQQMIISPSAHDDFSLGNTRVIGQDEGGYYVLTSNLSLGVASDRIGLRSRRYRLARLDTNLVRKWDMDVTGHDRGIPDAVTFFNDRVMVVSSVYDKAQQQISYFVAYIDEAGKTETVSGAVAVISPVGSDHEKAQVVISASRQYFALVLSEFTEEGLVILHSVVVNDSLQGAVAKSVSLPFPENDFEVRGYSVSNEGDLAILGLHSERVRILSSRRKNDYYLFTACAGCDSLTRHAINPSLSVTGLDVTFDNVNGKAVAAGFYMAKDSYLGAGIIYSTIGMNPSDTLKIITAGLDTQQNVRLRGERNRGASLDLISYPIERIVPRQDGGAVIVAEAAYTTEYSYYDSFMQSFSRRIEYNYENILVISIAQTGSTDWSAVIEKRQVSLDDGGVYSSFCSLLNSEQIGMVYNSQISRRNRVSTVTVSNRGETGLVKSLPATDGLFLLPRGSKQVSENALVAPALIKRKLHFVKIAFPL